MSKETARETAAEREREFRRAISKKGLLPRQDGVNQILLEEEATEFLLEEIALFNSEYFKSFKYSLTMEDPPTIQGGIR